MHNSLVRTSALTLVSLALALPFAVQAQDDLTATIRAEILKDPRAAQIPQAQMDTMVAALAEAASKQGVTSSDITWRPAEVDPSLPYDETPCEFFCYVNSIFGFGGGDYVIPLGLGVSSAILILIISMMLHRHHKHGVHPTIEAIHEHPLH